jgi:hypothetical protein
VGLLLEKVDAVGDEVEVWCHSHHFQRNRIGRSETCVSVAVASNDDPVYASL